MLYSNLPDYTDRSRRREGLPTALPKRQTVQPLRSLASRNTPGVTARQHQHQGSLPAAWARTSRQSVNTDMPKRRLLRSKSLVVGMAVLLLGISISSGLFPPPSITQAFAAITTTETEKQAAAQKARMDTYTDQINRIVAAHPGQNISISTIDITSGSALTLGDQGTFTAASTAKLLTAITYLHEVETGRAKLTTYISGVQAQDLLERMIADSDNSAWQALNDYLTHDTLQAYTAKLGWTEYDSGINSLLPAEMAALTAKLYQGKLLNATHTKLLLSFMQDANKQDYIVSAVPTTGYTVYHKAGWLDGLMHDVAIITNGQKTIVLAIYTYKENGDGDSLANQELFADITKSALAAYFPSSDNTN
jgi:beta-lactamase class A